MLVSLRGERIKLFQYSHLKFYCVKDMLNFIELN